MNPPTKTTDNRLRVFRGGGCWHNYGPSRVRAAIRNADEPAYQDNNLGFRCALRGRGPRV